MVKCIYCGKEKEEWVWTSEDVFASLLLSSNPIEIGICKLCFKMKLRDAVEEFERVEWENFVEKVLERC